MARADAMSSEAVFLIAAAVLAAPLSWALRGRRAFDVVAAWSLGALAIVSPSAAAWLLLSSVGTFRVARALASSRHAGVLTASWAAALLAALLVTRERPRWEMLGAAYFTLRNLHLLLDAWMGRLPRIDLRRLLHYQLFLPVLVAGPIHRFQNFDRAVDRRRLDVRDLATGAERVLFGLASATILGGFALNEIEGALRGAAAEPRSFCIDWAHSALTWIRLYFVFSGFSSVAIGAARMMGIEIEENFEAPLAARNLVDFWTRWHVTLSMWCRDYVFQPVAAATRSALIGLFCAMLAMGLWHETSSYYALWAAWQVAGIAGNRWISGWTEAIGLRAPGRAIALLGPLPVLGWLSLAHPVLTRLLGAAT